MASHAQEGQGETLVVKCTRHGNLVQLGDDRRIRHRNGNERCDSAHFEIRRIDRTSYAGALTQLLAEASAAQPAEPPDVQFCMETHVAYVIEHSAHLLPGSVIRTTDSRRTLVKTLENAWVCSQ